MLREAKALVPSAWNWAHETKYDWSNFEKLADGLYRAPDPFLRVHGKYVFRRIGADAQKIELGKNPGKKLERKLVGAMGFDLASIHAADARGKRAILADLKKRPDGWLHAAAKIAAAAVERDFRGMAELMLSSTPRSSSATTLRQTTSGINAGRRTCMLIPIADVPRWYAERKPKDTIAVSHGADTLTWEQLERNANRRARAFAAKGVKPGDFVAIGLPNSNAFFETTFAVWKCGATPTSLTWRLPRGEAAAVLDILKPSLVVGGQPDWNAPNSLPADFVPEGFSDEPLAAIPWRAIGRR